jgi:very-short-patch-repair endonuclease
MRVNIVFSSLLTRWRPVAGIWRQSLGSGAIFSRPYSSRVALENKAGQPGYRKKKWSAGEIQVLKSKIAMGLSLKDVVQSCAILLSDRTSHAIKMKCIRLHGPFVIALNECKTKDAQRVLDLAASGWTTLQIREQMAHRGRRYVYDVIERHKVKTSQITAPATAVPWSVDEDTILLNGLAAGKRASELTAELPGRSLSAINSRMGKISNAGGRTIKYPRKVWSADEDAVLMAMCKAGELYRNIASHLRRSLSAVDTRLSLLLRKEHEKSDSRSESSAKG